MRADERAVVLGEDVAEGGPWGATAGLADEFGVERVLNTRSARPRSAVSRSGNNPACAPSWSCSSTSSRSRSISSSTRPRSTSCRAASSAPLVLHAGRRGPARQGAAPGESRGLADARAGLKVVMPSTAADAAGLLRSAIADPNPVVYVENKTLYFSREDIAGGPAEVPLGRARVARPGRDGRRAVAARAEALAAAEELAAEGIEIEVIDPRTLVLRPRVDRRVRRADIASSSPTRQSRTAVSAPRSRHRSRPRPSTARRSDRAGRRTVRAHPVQPTARGCLPPGSHACGSGRSRLGR